MTTSQASLSKVARRSRLRAYAVLFALAAMAALGMVSNDQGQLEAAIAAQRARVAISANATDLNDLANLLVVRGDLAEAEDAYRQALALAPESIEVPYNLALLLQHRELNREALKLFRSVVKKVPEAAWAHLQIGVLSADLGKRRQAIQAFSKAFALEPRLASPRINPHLVGRPEVLEAMLNATSDAKAPQTAPLSFSEPDRIARLLVGESAAARAAAKSIERRGLVEPPEATMRDSEETPKQARRLDVESLPTSAQSESQPAQRLPEAGTEEAFESADAEPSEPGQVGSDESAGSTTDERAVRRVVGADDLRAVRGGGVTAPQSPAKNGRSARPAGPSRFVPGSAGGTAARPSSGGGSSSSAGRARTSRFRPGARSSVRLELREMPTGERPVSRWTASEAP